MTLQLPNLGIRSEHYAFLRRPTSYLRRYKVTHPEALPLRKEPTKRQLKTAKAILRRLRSQKGVMLADDVGLGKTSVAALVACVFAGRGKSVRVLAPNATMARRWRHELSLQLQVVEALMRAEKRGARGLDPERLSRAHERMERFVRNLGAGDIQVTTHFRGAQGTLTCDLLVVDEAHRARSEWSQFGSALSRRKADYGRILLLTATPFSLRYSELSRALKLLGADGAVHEASDFGKHLEKLWKAEFADPVAFGQRVAEKGNNAVKALKSWVIRHGVNELPRERKEYGRVAIVADEHWPRIRRSIGGHHPRRPAPSAGSRYRASKSKDDKRSSFSSRLELPTTGDEQAFGRSGLFRSNSRRRCACDVITTGFGVGSGPSWCMTRWLWSFVSCSLSSPRGEKVLVFCDHHATAQEITLALRNLDSMRSEVSLSQAQWRKAWRECLTSRLDADRKTGDKGLDKRFGAFLDWLACGAIRAQVGAWLRTRPATVDALTDALIRERARRMASGSIADEAARLFRTLNDEDSRSTRAVLETRGAEGLPGWGTAFVPVMSGAEPPESGKYKLALLQSRT